MKRAFLLALILLTLSTIMIGQDRIIITGNTGTQYDITGQRENMRYAFESWANMNLSGRDKENYLNRAYYLIDCAFSQNGISFDMDPTYHRKNIFGNYSGRKEEQLADLHFYQILQSHKIQPVSNTPLYNSTHTPTQHQTTPNYQTPTTQTKSQPDQQVKTQPVQPSQPQSKPKSQPKPKKKPALTK